MKSKDFRVILIIVLVVLLAYLVFKFLGSIPFWIWVAIAVILAYLNWTKIKRTLGHL